LKITLNLTLFQHFHDENHKLQEVHPCFEIKPPSNLVLTIFLNSRTLVILLQVDFVFSDEPKIICKSLYEIETLQSLHGFHLSTFDIIIGCVIRFLNYLLTSRHIT
jgi:hypothetical protein